jgi:hypothetical protein
MALMTTSCGERLPAGPIGVWLELGAGDDQRRPRGGLPPSWALEATVGPRPLGPNEVVWMDRAVAALAGTGLDGNEMLDVAATLIGHVRSMPQEQSAAPGGAAEQAVVDGLAPLLSSQADRLPALTAAVASARAHGGRGPGARFRPGPHTRRA